MAVVYNKETGQHENVDDSAINPNLHEAPLISPDGTMGSAPMADAPSLIQQGYTQPNSEQLQHLIKKADYESTSGQLKTAAEGAAEALTFGLSTGMEKNLGVDPKDIQGRREANPGVHAVGQGVGLLGGMLTGSGEGAILDKLGSMGAKALPLSAESAIGRVGTAAAKAGIENMVFQSGDEASKMFSEDPNQSIETALGSIGLAGVLGSAIGGGIGGTSELWKVTAGPKIDAVLHAIKARTGGLSAEMKAAADINIPVELDAALAGDQQAISNVQHLQESSSKAGAQVREAVGQFRNDTADKLAEVVGMTPDDAISMSEAEAGKALKTDLVKDMKAKYEPISNEYAKINDKFQDSPLLQAQKADVTNKLSDLATEEGWVKAPSSAQNKLINKVIEEMPLQENALDLKNYITNLRNSAPYGSETYHAAKKIIGVLGEAQEGAVSARMLEKEPGLVEHYAGVKKSYKDFMTEIDNLNDKIKVGRYHGPQSFIEALDGMEPETILKRLSPSGDTTAQGLIQKEYPQLADVIRKHEMAKLMRVSGSKTDAVMDPSKFFARLDKLSPEMKQFLIKPEMQPQLDALRTLHEALPKTTNPSGTARTMDGLFTKGAASALGLATAAMSHSGPMGLITGYLAHLLGKEAPDAVRLAMLKFLASGERVSAEGLKAAAQMAKHTIEGEAILDKATKGLLKDTKVLKFPTPKDRELLKKQVQASIEKPEALLSVGGQLGHYLPEHGVALASATARNLSYLASIRPQVAQAAPLDTIMKVSKTEESKYDRALDIAQNPNIVLKDIKDGTITLDDIKHLKTMYPALYQRINDKVMHAMIDAQSKGQTIPYKTKVGLSMFMGQPLDSSMSPHSIRTNQGTFVNMPQLQQQGQIKQPSATKMQNLNKLPSAYSTPGQARERYKSTGHR